jgi:Ca2+/H+ antiporter
VFECPSSALCGPGAGTGEPLYWSGSDDLAFQSVLVLSVFLAVLITGQVASDGRSDWLKGVQLLVVYLVLGLTYFFLPSAASHG